MKQINFRKVCTDYYQHKTSYLPEPIVEPSYFERADPFTADLVEGVVQLQSITGAAETSVTKNPVNVVKTSSASSQWDL